MSRPLHEVLADRVPGDFTPGHPRRPPWYQPRPVIDEVAYTGNVAVVNLRYADRVTLHGLGRRPAVQDWDFPEDWLPITWGVDSPG